jgi:hypothetical protein
MLERRQPDRTGIGNIFFQKTAEPFQTPFTAANRSSRSAIFSFVSATLPINPSRLLFTIMTVRSPLSLPQFPIFSHEKNLITKTSATRFLKRSSE